MIDFDPEIPYELRPNLEAKVEAIETRSRKIGLYLSRALVTPLQDGKPGILCTFDVGDVAFVKRVQNPEQAAFDQQFEELTTDMTSSEYDAIREELLRNIATGRDPLDEGEANG